MCKVCPKLHGWKVPPSSRVDGKRTKPWSKMLSHMTEHVNLDRPGKHVPLLKEMLDIRAKEKSLSETVSFNLTYLAYKQLLSGNSYR